jgi:pilus assembly protein TadC
VIVLLPLLAFLFVSLLVAAGAMAMSPGRAAAIDRRLGEIRGIGQPTSEGVPYSQIIADSFKKLGRYAPKRPSEAGKLERKLVAAGYRSKEAMPVFIGIRLGYLLPTMMLGRLAQRRQHRIRLSLPDALDLLVVSVEAGLGLDQALQRVGQELAFAHPDLCDELRLVNLELRAGNARSEALHNLADRTGVEDLSSLVAMLVQTDKFGTSIAQSLRVHSETLRTKRRQRAEEAAAKTGVKMVFPLVFCIFPAIWVVTIGPAAIKFVQVLFPMGQK